MLIAQHGTTRRRLVWRANPVGACVAMITGGIYVLAGLNAFRAELWWDANFYSITGLHSSSYRWWWAGFKTEERGGDTD